MKKTEKVALKLVKKGFTVTDWKDFSDEIKANDLILSELAKKLEAYDIESIREITNSHPFVISHLSSKIQFMSLAFCNASASLNKIPSDIPLPVAAITATGVAKPNEHGHEITKTQIP